MTDTVKWKAIAGLLVRSGLGKILIHGRGIKPHKVAVDSCEIMHRLGWKVRWSRKGKYGGSYISEATCNGYAVSAQEYAQQQNCITSIVAIDFVAGRPEYHYTQIESMMEQYFIDLVKKAAGKDTPRGAMSAAERQKHIDAGNCADAGKPPYDLIP